MKGLGKGNLGFQIRLEHCFDLISLYVSVTIKRES